MTPAKLTARRAELKRQSDELHHSMMEISREIRVTNARLSEIDFAIVACGDCDVSGEAGEGIEASMATSGAPGAENASAGEFGGQSLGAATDERLDGDTPALGEGHPPSVSESPSTKKPRAPKRDIRGMVIQHLERNLVEHPTIARLAEGLGVPLAAVEKAVAYWQAKERVTLDGDVVLLLIKEPEPPVAPPEIMVGIEPDFIRVSHDALGLYAPPEAEAQQSEAAE